MSVNIAKYNPPRELVKALMELMDTLASDVRKQTGAPEGACCVAAITVLRGFIDAMEAEIKVLESASDPETKH
jgi:hypothetical protein